MIISVDDWIECLRFTVWLVYGNFALQKAGVTTRACRIL